MGHRTWLVALLLMAGAFVGIGVYGWYDAHGPRSADAAGPGDAYGCGATMPTASPSAVSRGGGLAVSSGRHHCNAPLPAGAHVTVSIRHSPDSEEDYVATVRHHLELEVPVGRDGEFETTVRIPDDFPPGEASVSVDDGAYTWCQDTGAGRGDGFELLSCVAHETAFTVR